MSNDKWPELFPVLVLSNGDVIYSPMGELKTSCDMDMRKFPYDTQVSSLLTPTYIKIFRKVQAYGIVVELS